MVALAALTMYYVYAIKTVFPFSEKRLLGPFETHIAAARMIRPVELAVFDDPEYASTVFRASRVFKRNCRPGALDLKRLDPRDVIEASK